MAAYLAGAEARQNAAPTSITVIAPIFSQLVAFSPPSNFVPVYDKEYKSQYILKAVPKGETLERWTQMITVTGAKDLAKNPKVLPTTFADTIAARFKRSCPKTFSSIGIGNLKLAGHDACAAVVSCGRVRLGGGTNNETALIMVIKGASDFYTIQWAERAPPFDSRPTIDKALWANRMNSLGPVMLCPIVPGEKAPYPSCTERK